MPVGAGNSRGSTGSSALAALAQAVSQRGGQPQDGAVPSPGGSTDSGLDLETLMAAMKSGQVSAASLIQLLSLLLGQGMMPQGSQGMQALQNAGQGGPPGGRGSQMGPGSMVPGLPGGGGGAIGSAFGLGG